jgi:hypothetical protein
MDPHSLKHVATRSVYHSDTPTAARLAQRATPTDAGVVTNQVPRPTAFRASFSPKTRTDAAGYRSAESVPE